MLCFSRLILLFLVVFELTISAQSLRIDPKEIQAGEAATLTWNTTGYPAFLIGYGKVSGMGSATIMPRASTNFTMVIETSSGIQYYSERLLIGGAMGSDEFPSLTEFRDVGYRESRSGIDYIQFQSAVWSALQDAGFSVKGDYVPKKPSVTFYTSFALRPDLISKDEKLRARRLALAVEIYEPKGGLIAFGVRPMLQFQYRGESEWRSEHESSLAGAEAMKEAKLLLSVR